MIDPAEHAVVVLNYRGRSDTLECLGSIFADEETVKRVYLVDNASDDDVIREAEARWASVTGIQLQENCGFSGGMNVGIRAALTDGCSIVTVLNNDTIIPKGVLSSLARATLSSSSVAVSPTVMYAGQMDRTWFGGGIVDHARGIPRHLTDEELRERFEFDTDSEHPIPTEILAGCCITAAAETWSIVGLFDERFFLNFEDSDWSLRARARGVALQVISPKIFHKVSASFVGEYSYLGFYYYARNGILFALTRVGGMRFSYRFVRSQVLPTIAAPARRGDLQTSRRLTILFVHGLWALVAGPMGRADSRLEGRVKDWVASSGPRLRV